MFNWVTQNELRFALGQVQSELGRQYENLQAMREEVAKLTAVAADWKALAQEAMADNRELRARLLPPLPGERTTDPGEKRTTRDADAKQAELRKAAKQVVRR